MQYVPVPLPASGTLSYLDAGGEQTVVEVTPGNAMVVYGLYLDLSNMTQAGTVKVYQKIDGTNYREISSDATAAGESYMLNAVYGIAYDMKVTYTEAVDEGAARDLPYSYAYMGG